MEEIHWRLSHPQLSHSSEVSHHGTSEARRRRVLFLNKGHFLAQWGFRLVAPLQGVLQGIISCLLSHSTETPRDIYCQTEIFAILKITGIIYRFRIT